MADPVATAPAACAASAEPDDTELGDDNERGGTIEEWTVQEPGEVQALEGPNGFLAVRTVTLKSWCAHLHSTATC
jgi:hypothetical protein